MSSKRALVVDDSKSARAFLSRILERHEIMVDAAESAEAAIDYLTRNRPDVIFMDHMMPGMDGFQAVQSIKNNPRTAAIPILMYTSQEGDLYLGQARALGAEGVLPKQIKQADVTKMLFQLQLVSDRRKLERSVFTAADQAPDLVPANESAIESTIVVDQPDSATVAADQQFALLLPTMTLEIRAALDHSLQKEIAALRGFIGTTLESHAERLQGDLATLLPATRTPDLDLPTVMPERRPWGAILGWLLAVIGTAGAAFMTWMWWNQGGEMAALRTDLSAAYAELEALRAKPVVVSPAPLAAPPEVAVGLADPNAVLPDTDAPDAAAVTTSAVELVPSGEGAAPVFAPSSPAPAATLPAAAAPGAGASPSAAVPPASQAQ
jgi:CheY-like chemotaxis protein